MLTNRPNESRTTALTTERKEEVDLREITTKNPSLFFSLKNFAFSFANVSSYLLNAKSSAPIKKTSKRPDDADQAVKSKWLDRQA